MSAVKKRTARVSVQLGESRDGGREGGERQGGREGRGERVVGVDAYYPDAAVVSVSSKPEVRALIDNSICGT